MAKVVGDAVAQVTYSQVIMYGLHIKTRVAPVLMSTLFERHLQSSIHVVAMGIHLHIKIRAAPV